MIIALAEICRPKISFTLRAFNNENKSSKAKYDSSSILSSDRWWEEELCAAITDGCPDRKIIFTKQLVATLFVIFLTVPGAARGFPRARLCLGSLRAAVSVLYVAGVLGAPQPLLSTDNIYSPGRHLSLEPVK